jgi:catechol 2,3-dioxygenase-like lactoylglutathione lyase family enzyme
MSLRRLDHINISTTKPEETRDFFVKLFDLKEGARPDFAFPGHWLYLGQQAVVHIVGRDRARAFRRGLARPLRLRHRRL